MYFSTKNYLKSNHNYTIKYTQSHVGHKKKVDSPSTDERAQGFLAVSLRYLHS
jgi:hypothetical protein